MHDLHQALRMPAPGFARDAGQRAAFGNFCLNAASFPLPSAVEHRVTPDHNIYFIRRRFVGIRSPMVNMLIEPRSTGPQDDVWGAGEAVLSALSEPEPPHIVKLFLAGSARERAREIGRAGPGRYQGVFLPFDTPEALELPSDYESLLRSLGRHTRRDMRRVRRDSQHAGFVFEFCQAAGSGAAERQRLGQATHPRRYRPEHIDAYDTFLAAQENPFHAVLRSRTGELISCCAGLIADGAAYVLYQLNHEGYRDSSLSLTNRSFTIEHLIRLGLREFVLPGGGSGILIHACRMREDGELVLIRRSAAAILKSAAVTLLRPQSSVAVAVRCLATRWMG
jgi:hypothetical protein